MIKEKEFFKLHNATIQLFTALMLMFLSELNILSPSLISNFCSYPIQMYACAWQRKNHFVLLQRSEASFNDVL